LFWCRKTGAKTTTIQAPKIAGVAATLAKDPAPSPVTMVSVTYADGTKGAPVFSRKGGPFCESWFSQLPPGLDQGDVDTATWITGDTDRITCDKFLDLLAHRILPEHRAKVGPSGKLFWWVDGPTAHGLTQDYKLREDIAMFAVKNNICLIYFPHNATHKMQPNDQVVHLLLKMGMAEILRKARESWGNIHYYICQKDLVAAKPTVSRKHTRKGLLSAGDGSLRDPSMRSSQYRAAHFHTGDSRSKFSFTQRDHIIAAMWVWKNSITEEAVKISWAVCFLIPFNPRATRYTRRGRSGPRRSWRRQSHRR